MAQQNKGKGHSRRSGSGSTKGQNTLQHPGAVLAQILEGRAPMTAAMAQQAGAVFGTGSAPWLEMQSAWDAAHAETNASQH